MRFRALTTVLLLCVLAGITFHSHAQTVNPTQEPDFLSETDWPKTCTEAVDRLVQHLDAESKDLVRDTSRDDLVQFHHGWGTGIRNDFGLWRGNDALIDSCLALDKAAERHPDAVSMIIIKQLWLRLAQQ